jgi:hypothetical protein
VIVLRPGLNFASQYPEFLFQGTDRYTSSPVNEVENGQQEEGKASVQDSNRMLMNPGKKEKDGQAEGNPCFGFPAKHP